MQVGLMLTKVSSYKKSYCVIYDNNPCKVALLFFYVQAHKCESVERGRLREGGYENAYTVR